MLYIKVVNGNPEGEVIEQEDANVSIPLGHELVEDTLEPTYLEQPITTKQVRNFNCVYDSTKQLWVKEWYVRDLNEEEISALDRRNNEALMIIASLKKEEIQIQINETDKEDDVSLKILGDYLTVLDNTFGSNVELYDINIPSPPRKSNSGMWLDVNNSGSKPDVIE